MLPPALVIKTDRCPRPASRDADGNRDRRDEPAAREAGREPPVQCEGRWRPETRRTAGFGAYSIPSATPPSTAPRDLTTKDSPPRPEPPVPEPVLGRIRRRPVFGGLINEYEPAALTGVHLPLPSF